MSGRVVTTGSDGKIVVYGETWEDGGEGEGDDADGQRRDTGATTKWTVLAEMECAHGVYEVNHVTWVRRWDHLRKSQGNGTTGDDEMIVSTGDDGEVKAWVVTG